MRAQAEIVEDGKTAKIVVTEIPYQTSVEAIEEKAAELVDRREIEGGPSGPPFFVVRRRVE